MAKYRIPSDYKNQTSKAQHPWPSGAAAPIHPGLAYPVHHRHLNTGDRISGSINTLIQSEPMEGPLLNGFRLVTIATFTPDSVAYGWLNNGKRFSPTQYRSFDKWYFDPTGTGLVTPYQDAVFHETRSALYLTRGISVPESATSEQVFEKWSSDFTPNMQLFGLSHVGRGGLWDWLGVPPGTVLPRMKNGASAYQRWPIMPFLSYLLSHYYYIANMQEDNVYFTRNIQEMCNGLSSVIAEAPFSTVFSSLSPNAFLDFIVRLNYLSGSGVAGNISRGEIGVSTVPLYAMLYAGLGAHGGLLSVPYSPDFFTNIIKQGSSPSVNIPVIEDADSETTYSVAVPDLRLWTKIQNYVDRLFVSGGRIGDVFRTLWGVNSSPYSNKPDFLGVWQQSINPSNVVASANGSADGFSANLGQMAARIDSFSSYDKGGKIDYYAKEPGTFMLITMLIPQPSYFQGLHPDLMGLSFADDYNPELAGIGFQSVPRGRFSMMPQGFNSTFTSTSLVNSPWFYVNSDSGASIDPNSISVGETIAWDWLRTDYSRLHGEFAQNGNYQYWVLGRRFSDYFLNESGGGTYSDSAYYGSYVNPLAWQYIFATHSLSDPNFIFMGDFNLKVVSSLPANYMPFLGR